MNFRKITLFLLMCVFLLVSCLSGCIDISQEAVLAISSPINRAHFDELNDITIEVEVENFDLVDEYGENNVVSQGHLIYYMDIEPPTNLNDPAFSLSGTYVVSIETNYTWENVLSGKHNFSVQLVNNDHTPLDPPVIKTIEVTVGEAKNYSLVSGWYKNNTVHYYDFGKNTSLSDGMVDTAPIFVFAYGFNADGTLDVVPEQANIIDAIPSDSGYSDLWQVNIVSVPSTYQPNSVRSLKQINKNQFNITQTDTLVNCPIIPAGSTLENGKTLKQGWYRNQKVYYPDFGANPKITAPIYVLITGTTATGEPELIKGQRNIIDVLPGDQGYSNFWQITYVTVPDGYETNSITSLSQIVNKEYLMNTTSTLVNCPVLSSIT